uniref:Uncharacterized protein n=1 Tax=Jakoba libera TaxID=143017 RepID=M4QCI5_JAKLI|nr:hypothetical protein L048_p001 [Jakoba libera]YP_007890760.1 hypothetical protein L048_p002 [Jakoba libera]AGH24171.1 hypothetical protein [Jakoba libera]AGH24254.1 hypothetical protein [Jakoba libera]
MQCYAMKSNVIFSYFILFYVLIMSPNGMQCNAFKWFVVKSCQIFSYQSFSFQTFSNVMSCLQGLSKGNYCFVMVVKLSKCFLPVVMVVVIGMVVVMVL